MTIEAEELERLFVSAVHDVHVATDPDKARAASERLELVLHARVALAQHDLARELAEYLASRARAYEASVTFLVTRASPSR